MHMNINPIKETSMKPFLAVFTAFFPLFACSGCNGAPSIDGTNGARRLQGSAIDGSNGAPSIDGTWISWTSSNTGTGLTINADGTYVLQQLTLLSPTSGEEEVQTGIIEVGDNTLTFTPVEWSCSGPYPAFTWNYTFDGALLDIDTGSAMVSYSADTAAASSFTVVFGCYDQSGNFTAHPLDPVGVSWSRAIDRHEEGRRQPSRYCGYDGTLCWNRSGPYARHIVRGP
jgi:hypothetical protein